MTRRRKLRLLAVGALALIAATVRGELVRVEGEYRVPAERARWAAAAPLVAHAGGGVDGLNGTNSREAFEASCRAGYRAIELDFAETADGQIVARHDWLAVTATILGQPLVQLGGVPWTVAEVLATPIRGHYHTLDLPTLADLLARYPAVRLITDTKATDATNTRRIFRKLVAVLRARGAKLPDQVVPQFYNEAMGRAVLEVHPFPDRILTLYQLAASDDEVLAICERLRVNVVTMPPWRARPAFLARLAHAGVLGYVHTINEPAVMAAFRGRGVYGFYTDGVLPEDDPGSPAARRQEGLHVSVAAH